MHRSRLADKPSAKFLQDVIDRDEDLMKPLDVFLVVRSVLGVLRERCRRWSLVRDRTDLRLDAELRKV